MLETALAVDPRNRWRLCRSRPGRREAASLRQGDSDDEQGAAARAQRPRRHRGPRRGDGRDGRNCSRSGRTFRSCRRICGGKGLPAGGAVVAGDQPRSDRGFGEGAGSSEEKLAQRPRELHEFLDAERFGAALQVDAERFRRLRARPGMFFRLDRSILRRWPKAASVSRSSILALTPSRLLAGTMCTTADVTFGGGTNAERLTGIAIRGLRAPLRRDRQAAVSVAARLQRRCARRLPSGTSVSAIATMAASRRRAT